MERQYIYPPGVDNFGQNNQLYDNSVYNQMQGHRRLSNQFDNGFQLSDQSAGRVIRPSDNNFKPGEYDKSVSELTKFDHTNSAEAVKEAAAKGGGITFMMISQSTKDSQKLLEQMKDLKAKDPSMTFVVLDKDKIKADPGAQKWQDYVQKSTNGDNLAFSSLQSVKSDASGKPAIDRVVSTHWGGDVKADVVDQSRFARQFTTAHKYDAAYLPERSYQLNDGSTNDVPVQVLPKTSADELFAPHRNGESLLPNMDNWLRALEKEPGIRHTRPWDSRAYHADSRRRRY